ncbi:hypothetical protein AeMF1_005081 [Aphanomyces euteiches]|nr:hypothetical protein AeMF1_014319 [Aphanomyces euteiches]KAH9112506.1 hypothetical protein AeMF1_013178 [Aphanomyces euteiches]KAH9118699.1 hypothetical protein AeMF1_008276 [Aphanomyces euteiches]KAH9121169.1 hypothetical protein AeMF1_007006 [Aphanomyces euteiches]KAH9124092.1 hypothetical protein AeMF1_005081 [Aphanomyces euteiches]
MTSTTIVPLNEAKNANARGGRDRSESKESNGMRRFPVGTSHDGSVWPSNQISTSLYNPYNFVFKNTFKQFSRLSNMYFLFITVLQVIPQVTLSGGYPTTIVPLLFVLFVNAVKDLIEDIHRHNADTVQNSTTTHRMSLETGQSQFAATTWADLQVGSVVKVCQNEIIPADLIILASSSPIGQCFTMTANLDGETNLKIRWVPSNLLSSESFTEKDCAAIWSMVEGATVEAEPPNRRLDKFKATITTRDGKKTSIGMSNLLLRGVQLRDTAWVAGVTVYTGKDTKIQQNAGETPFKASNLSKLTNIMTYQIIVLQIVLQLIAVIVEAYQKDVPYIPSDSKSVLNSFWLFLTYMLLFSNFVPISLQVTLDITRFFQAIILRLDEEMAQGGIGVTVRVSDLNEDLGIIQHIFTDKTGTLTCNNMEFRKCAIDGVSYGKIQTDVNRTPRGGTNCGQAQNNRLVSILPFGKRAQTDIQSPRTNLTHVNIVDEALTAKILDERNQRFVQFFINLAVNSAVVPIIDPNSGDLIYSAISPDEEALVCAAKHFGIALLRHDTTSVTLNQFGDTVQFDVLHMFEFTSDRKKSSIIVRDKSTSNIMLYCKGADTVIFPALRPPINDAEEKRQNDMKQHLLSYAAEGLRVLCVAQRELSDSLYKSWNEKYQTGKTSPDASEEVVDNIIREIENELDLVGITGIEDRLQDGVADALQCFRLAGIKVWMLTGDRPDTALNIGRATQLISNDMLVVYLSTKELSVSSGTPVILAGQILSSITDSPKSDQFVALILDDMALELICGTELLQNQLIKASTRCKSVLCCRVSPKQKEFIVDLVRRKTGVMTLAIGDGANDVPMIQRAHVGVGIIGAEGQQAANASDYSIPEFQSLKRLLLVHGKWMNRRMAILTLYMFHKNILLVMPQFFFGMYCAFSGQSTYYDPLYQLFNVCFTALPIFLFSVFDEHVSPNMSLNYPLLYTSESFISISKFWCWIFDAVFASLLILLLHIGVYQRGSVGPNGLDQGLWDMGLVMNGVVVLVANLRLAIETKCWYRFTLMGFLFSLGLWVASACTFSSLISFGGELYQVLNIAPTFSIFLLFILLSALCCFGVFIIQAYTTSFEPNPSDICHEIDVFELDITAKNNRVHPE